jgi:MFS family permease
MSCLFAVGFLILANSRPYEGLVYSLPLFGYLAYKLLRSRPNRRRMAAMLLPAFAMGAAGLIAMGAYNRATTGSAIVMPYTLNHHTYWPLPFFVGQKENPDAKIDDPAFVKFFQSTAKAYDYDKTTSLSGMAEIEVGRIIRNWVFYVGLALTFPVVVGFISSLTQSRLYVAGFAFIAISMALAVCIYNITHYFAPATIAVYVFAVEGLRYMWDTTHLGERAFVIAVCITVALTSSMPQSVTNALYTKYNIADGREKVMRQLEREPGRYLVLVSYDLDRHYPGAELVHNGAEFGSEKILWARSKSPEADAALCAAYGDRTFVSVTTDDVKFSLKPLNICR